MIVAGNPVILPRTPARPNSMTALLMASKARHDTLGARFRLTIIAHSTAMRQATHRRARLERLLHCAEHSIWRLARSWRSAMYQAVTTIVPCIWEWKEQ